MSRPDDRGLSPDRIDEIASAAMASSTADETEIAWIEYRERRAGIGPGATAGARFERSVLVRVIDRGRLGSHHTSPDSARDLEEAIRQAQASSRSCEPLTDLRHLPADSGEVPQVAPLFSQEVVDLDRPRAENLLSSAAVASERASLTWRDGRVAVLNSRGIRRSCQVTTVDGEVSCGERVGAGWAAASARTLEDLGLAGLVDRARRRHSDEPGGDLPEEPPRLLFSPEATGQLLCVLRDEAFTARAYVAGLSFLREHSGVQVFDHTVNLLDDGTDPRALPFPFDLEGIAKHRVELIDAGTPRTPALDSRQSAALGLQSTGHASGGGEARPENLVLLPGDLEDDELLRRADGGLWIPRLLRVECFDSHRMLLRLRARGARVVSDGRLGAALPDLVWEGSLLRMLADLEGLGRDLVTRSQGSAILGGIAAPASLIRCGTLPTAVGA